jgi:hypothetical protein
MVGIYKIKMQILILTTNTDPQRQVRYLGPYQIAWWLRSNGYSTQVLDYIYFMTKEPRYLLTLAEYENKPLECQKTNIPNYNFYEAAKEKLKNLGYIDL